MSFRDIPVEREESTFEDMPLSVGAMPVHSERTENFLATQAAFLDAYINNTNPAENLARYQGSLFKDEEVNRLAAEKAQVDHQEILENFVSNPTDDIQQQAAFVSSALALNATVGSNPDLQFAESIAGGNFNPEDIKREASRFKMFKILSDWEESISTGQNVGEFGKLLFVPFIESARGRRLTGRYFGQQEDIRRAMLAFQALPEEEQAELFPVLVEELKEKVGDVAGLQIAQSFINPFGPEEFDRFGAMEKAIDALAVAGLGSIAGMALRGVRASVNVPKAMKRLDNEEGAAEVVKASVMDPNIARATNQDEVTAIGNALPFNTSDLDAGHVSGLSAQVQRNLQGYYKELDGTVEDIMARRGFMDEGIFNTADRAAFEAKAIQRFKALEAEDIRIVEQTSDYTSFSYKFRDENGVLREASERLSYTLGDVGHYEQSTMSLIGEFLGSPSAWAKGSLAEDAATAQRLDYLTARVASQLMKQTKEALRPIGLTPTPANKRSLAKVDKALMEGDEWKNIEAGTRGKVWNVDELRTQFGLETNEIEAYYRIRRVYDNLWRLRNNEKRKEMVNLGFQNVNLARSGESTYGKPLNTASDAQASLRSSNTNYVYDADAGELVNVRAQRDDFFSNLYNSDRQIVRLEQPYSVDGDIGAVQYVLTSRSNVTDLPERVLAWKDGYVPRIYEDAVYFVKQMDRRTLDGDKTFTAPTTLRFFSSRKDADTYVEQLVRQDADAAVARAADRMPGLTDAEAAVIREKATAEARERYVRLADREQETLSAATGEFSHGASGLYTGARADDALLYGLEGDKASRVNSFEALTRNIGNVSRYTSLNQWRLGMEARWINTANEILKAKGVEHRVKSFDKLPELSTANAEARFLNNLYDQIRDWQNFPTPEERIFQSSVQRLYDWSADRNMARTAKFIGNFRNADPIAAARATAFHSLLGFFNPAQLWVQAQGAAVAMSLGFGKYMTRSLGNAGALAYLGYGAVDSARYARVAKAMSAGGLKTSKEDLRTMHQLWIKTGYQDSVMQTADYAAAMKGYGMTMNALKETADKGLLFYRQGELANRRTSFATALERWKEKNPGKTLQQIDDDALKLIMNDANNMMLNMTKANRAAWQKGALSLPTQFLQVTTKFAETALGFNQHFTAAERARLLTGQLVLYGAAGIPLVGLPIMIATQVMGVTQEDIENNPTLVKAINDGFWGVTSFHLFGVDVELSSRGSLLRGISDFMDNWFMQESTMASQFLGAFGSTGDRFLTEFTRQLRPFTIANMSEIEFRDVANLVTSPVLQSISTWRNVEKAEYMRRLGEIYSTRGRLQHTGDFNFWDIAAQAAGFQHTATTEAFELQKRASASTALERKITDEILIKMNEFSFRYPNGDFDEDAIQAYERDISLLYGVLDVDERMRVQRAVNAALMSPTTRDQAVNVALDNLKNTTADQMGVIRTTLMGNKILRLGIPTEEQE